MHLEAIIRGAFLSFLAKFAIHATSKRICYTISSRMENIRWESLNLKKPMASARVFRAFGVGSSSARGIANIEKVKVYNVLSKTL